jgi:hypothetical protein
MMEVVCIPAMALGAAAVEPAPCATKVKLSHDRKLRISSARRWSERFTPYSCGLRFNATSRTVRSRQDEPACAPRRAMAKSGEEAMLKTLIHALLGLTLALGLAAASVQPADAGHRYHRHHGHHGHHGNGGSFAAGVATGIIGLGVLGAIAHARNGAHCYEGPRRCGWRDQHCFENRWGRWVCRGGHYSCWRPTYCDD